MEEVQAYMQETELSRRVQEWEARIRPILTIEVTRLDYRQLCQHNACFLPPHM